MMRPKVAQYQLFWVSADGTVHHRTTQGAPTTTVMKNGADRRKARYGTRYFPSLGKWRVWDFERIAKSGRKGSRSFIEYKTVYEVESDSEAAAVMWMVMHATGQSYVE